MAFWHFFLCSSFFDTFRFSLLFYIYNIYILFLAFRLLYFLLGTVSFFLDFCIGRERERERVEKFLWQSLCATCKDLLAKLLHFAYRPRMDISLCVCIVCFSLDFFFCVSFFFFFCLFAIFSRSSCEKSAHSCHIRCKAELRLELGNFRRQFKSCVSCLGNRHNDVS